MRNRLSSSYIWDLPWGSGRPWDLGNSVLNNLLGNWQVNGITTIQSGKPFTPRLGFSTANTGSPRPNRLREGKLSRDERTLQCFFDVDAFEPVEPFNFGNSGQFILIGPGLVNFDFSLFKRIPLRALGEQGELQFRTEFFNFLNTLQFGLPNKRVDLAQGGSMTSLANNMREIQFGLKILF